MTNKTYNIMKSVALIWLPAFGTFYFAIGDIWGIPYASQVVGSITALDTFLGAILGLASKMYSPPVDGQLEVDDSDPDSATIANFTLATSPRDAIRKDKIVFKVVRPGPPPVKVLPPPA